MAYIVRLGPHEIRKGVRGNTYVAIIDSDAWEGLESNVTAEDDESGLRAVIEQVGQENVANLVCAPALAEAAAKVGLKVGEPSDADHIDSWRHGIAFNMVIGVRVEQFSNVIVANDYALSCSMFESSLVDLEDRHPLVRFSVRSSGKFTREMVGFLALSEQTVAMSLFRDMAELERSHRMIAAEMAEDAIRRVGVFGVQRDDDHREFLTDAMAWASLEHFYIPMKITNGAACKMTLDELMLLSATLDAFGKLEGGEQATGIAEWDEDVLEVELELLPDEDPPVVPPNGARA